MKHNKWAANRADNRVVAAAAKAMAEAVAKAAAAAKVAAARAVVPVAVRVVAKEASRWKSGTGCFFPYARTSPFQAIYDTKRQMVG